MMSPKFWLFLTVAVLSTAGCASSSPPAASPESSGEASGDEPQPSEPVAPPPEPEPSESTESEAPPASGSTVAEPNFQPGMSVLDAVNAVPRGTDRVEIEQEVLVAPLQQQELYQPCSLKPNQHFDVKLAVWDGRVVGLDLSTSPKSASVEECLRRQIEGLTWKKRVKSLSTVEYRY